MNHISEGCLARLQAALSPTDSNIRDFILTKTRLHGRPFTLKGHEYQGKVIELLTDPDVDLVVTKPSQTGISEIIYRIVLGWMNYIPGFAAAVVFPTRAMSNEVFSTRINPIIDDCIPLRAIKNKNVDSNSVKMFLNDAILYALGASSNSRSTVINRPIRTVIADELARCDLGVITALRSRQRHQEHKSSVYFSTPLFENADIHAELNKCGVIHEQILRCSRCGHYFFPDFYKHARLPGFNQEIRLLKQDHVDKFHLNLEEAYLQCPKCERETSYEFTDFEWVDTAEHPRRPKVGLKLSAFCMPAFVQVSHMLHDWLAYEDKVEFHQQVLGLPASKADTAMDTNKICFENGEHGVVNVFGLDLGKICHLTIATVTSDHIFAHTLKAIPLKDLRVELIKYVSYYGCIAGVVDLMPYSDMAVEFSNNLQNTWSAIYTEPATPTPELFKYKIIEDSALGNVRQIQINKNLFIDTYVNELMNGRFIYKNSDQNDAVKDHHEAMRRVRDEKYNELRYKWVKTQGHKTPDHWFHSGIYCFAASRMMMKAASGSMPLSMMIGNFKLKNEL